MTKILAQEKLTVEDFGLLKPGVLVKKYTLDNGYGLKMSVINLGGIITNLEVPDQEGNPVDVVLGYDTLQEYQQDIFYIGCLVGRYANRIKNGRFKLQGQDYALEKNDGYNHIHGGHQGFHRAFWAIEPIAVGDDPGLQLTYQSADGEEGYPGKLEVKVIYVLKKDALEIRYEAITSKTTIINLTQHSYFNLDKAQDQPVLDHHLQLQAEKILEFDDTSCPTGTLLDARDTVFDFRKSRTVRNPAGENGTVGSLGYDHCYVLDNQGDLVKAAELRGGNTSLTMEVWTTEPAIQLYTGSFLTGKKGKNGTEYGPYCGLCLETQHHPDAPNHDHFPGTVLHPGEVFKSTTLYRFV